MENLCGLDRANAVSAHSFHRELGALIKQAAEDMEVPARKAREALLMLLLAVVVPAGSA